MLVAGRGASEKPAAEASSDAATVQRIVVRRGRREASRQCLRGRPRSLNRSA
jgi:hypothetical protein